MTKATFRIVITFASAPKSNFAYVGTAATKAELVNQNPDIRNINIRLRRSEIASLTIDTVALGKFFLITMVSSLAVAIGMK
tara:strand:- start:96 stop:338 length:243 start_codon:yes stop_codon:yes gene_type:complete